MNQVVWICLVVSVSLIASALAATLAAAIRHYQTPPEKRINTSRNAPKGATAVVFWIFAGLGCGVLVLMVGTALVMILLQSLDDPKQDKNPPPPPPKNQKQVQIPIEPIAPGAEDLGPKDKQTQILGGPFDPTFKDEAPAGGLLIGFDVGLGQAYGVELVKAIRPVYRTPKGGEAVGRTFGSDLAKTVRVRAKPGYAVAGVNVKAGAVVNGFSVKFMRVQGARLNPGDAYSSQWIGDQTGGGGPTLLAGDGTIITGVIGRRSASDCTGIGLLKR